MKLQIKLIPATFHDSDFILNIRNEPIVRKNSFSGIKIMKNEHKAYMKRTLLDKNRKLLIVTSGKEKIGYARLDKEDNYTAEIHIALQKEYRNKGYGLKAIEECCQTAFADGIKTIEASIKPENAVSVNVFKKAGFAVTVKTSKKIKMVKRNE